MEEIVINKFTRNKLTDLVEILIEDEYFAFIENAETYVNNLYNFIYSIPTQIRKKTSNPKYGVWYCKFHPNKNTTWYITFDTENDLYLIKNITNNHSKDYPDFIR